MKFSLTTTDSEIAVLTLLEPRVSYASLPSLKTVFLQLHESNRHRLVLDLRHAEYVDSSTLGVLIVALRRAISVGGDLKLVGLQPPVQAIVELTRLHQVFDIHETVREALGAFEAEGMARMETATLDKAAS